VPEEIELWRNDAAQKGCPCVIQKIAFNQDQAKSELMRVIIIALTTSLRIFALLFGIADFSSTRRRPRSIRSKLRITKPLFASCIRVVKTT
jgi:hypothetical protein